MAMNDISTPLASEFQRLFRRSSRLGPTAERKRRQRHERNVVREVEYRRNAEYEWFMILEYLKNVLVGDEYHSWNRPRRRNSRTVALRDDSRDHPTIPSVRSPRNVYHRAPSPPPAAPAVEPPRIPVRQPTQPVSQPLPTPSSEPVYIPTPALNPALGEPLPENLFKVTYDISRGPSSVCWKLSTLTFPWDDESFDLPAAWPPLVDMTITVVVDDPLPNFEWPIVVSNPDGLTCGDVIYGIWKAFHEDVGRREYVGWDYLTREGAKRAFYRRVQGDGNGEGEGRPTASGGSGVDGLKRIDYVLSAGSEGEEGGVMFRGLVPAFDVSGGWLLFVGPLTSQSELGKTVSD